MSAAFANAAVSIANEDAWMAVQPHPEFAVARKRSHPNPVFKYTCTGLHPEVQYSVALKIQPVRDGIWTWRKDGFFYKSDDLENPQGPQSIVLGTEDRQFISGRELMEMDLEFQGIYFSKDPDHQNESTFIVRTTVLYRASLVISAETGEQSEFDDAQQEFMCVTKLSERYPKKDKERAVAKEAAGQEPKAKKPAGMKPVQARRDQGQQNQEDNFAHQANEPVGPVLLQQDAYAHQEFDNFAEAAQGLAGYDGQAQVGQNFHDFGGQKLVPGQQGVSHYHQIPAVQQEQQQKLPSFGRCFGRLLDNVPEPNRGPRPVPDQQYNQDLNMFARHEHGQNAVYANQPPMPVLPQQQMVYEDHVHHQAQGYGQDFAGFQRVQVAENQQIPVQNAQLFRDFGHQVPDYQNQQMVIQVQEEYILREEHFYGNQGQHHFQPFDCYPFC